MTARDFAAVDLKYAGIEEAARLAAERGGDCNAGHAEARTSELAFKLRTRFIGMQPDPYFGDYELANCIKCKTTIGYPPPKMREELGMAEEV